MSGRVDDGENYKVQHALLPELELQSLKNRILNHMNGGETFQQDEIREHLRLKDSDVWSKILDELLMQNVGLFANYPEGHVTLGRKNLGRRFIQDLLFASVEEGLYYHLTCICEWFHKLERELNRPTLLNDFRQNNLAMLRACRKGEFNIVGELYKSGFRVNIKLGKEILDKHDEHLMLELCRLEAFASPTYLLSEYQYDHDKEDVDPVYKAFKFINICHIIGRKRKTMINKVDEINKSLLNSLSY